MDPALINQYLRSRGAAMSAGNANRVREHFAANPDLMERRAMGLPGGLDDNSSILDAMLEKQIADTGMAPTITSEALPDITPQRQQPAQPQAARAPQRAQTPTTRASRQGNYGPGPSPSRQGEYGPASNAAGVDELLAAEGLLAPGQSTRDAANADSGILKWLLPILGVSAAGALNTQPRLPAPRGPMSLAPPDSPLALPAPQRRLTNQGPDQNYTPMGEEIDTINNRNASSKEGRRRQLQSEVDAENDAMMRQMEEQERVRRAQKRTKDLGDAARRTTGRR